MYSNDFSDGFVFLENGTLRHGNPDSSTREYLLRGLWPHLSRVICCSQKNIPAFGIFSGSLMVGKHFGERQLRHNDPPIQNIFSLIFSTVSSGKFTVLSFGFEIILIDNSPQSNNSNQMNLIDYNDLQLEILRIALYLFLSSN